MRFLGRGKYPSLSLSNHHFYRTVIKVRGFKQEYFFISENDDQETSLWFENMKVHAVQLNLKVNYSIGSLLGKGNFANVYDVQHRHTGQWFAVKTVDKRTVLQSRRNIVSLNPFKILERTS